MRNPHWSVKRRSPYRWGCISVIWMCLITCLFLVLNGAVAAGIYMSLSPIAPGFRRLAQGLLYLGPVLLIFPEWWLVDWIVDRASGRTKKAS